MNSERSRPRSGPSEFREPEINREMLPGVMEGKSISPKKEKKPRKKRVEGGKDWKYLASVASAMGDGQTKLAAFERAIDRAINDRVRIDIIEELAMEKDRLSTLLSGTKAAAPIPAPVAGGAAPESKPPKDILPKTVKELRREYRKKFVDIIRLTPGKEGLNQEAVLLKLKMSYGFDPKNPSEVDLYRNITDEIERETIKKEIEDEILARCNLKEAYLKEAGLKSPKFGENTEKYLQIMESGAGADDQITNETIAWVSNLPILESDAERKVEKKGEEIVLCRRNVESAFQVFNFLGYAVNRYREAPDQGKYVVIGKLTSEGRKRLYTFEDEQRDENGVPILDATGKPKKYIATIDVDPRLKILVEDIFEKSLRASPHNIYAEDGNLEAVRVELISQLGKVLGEDATNLGWQAFEGLRCEGIHFSGHYLGVLGRFGETRQFLAKNYNSWYGSRLDRIAVFSHEYIDDDGEPHKLAKGEVALVDSKGKKLPGFDTRNISQSQFDQLQKEYSLNFRKEKIVLKGGKLVFEDEYNKKGRLIISGWYVPRNDVFVKEEDILILAPLPLTQWIKHKEGSASPESASWLFRWAVQGKFFELAARHPAKKTLEGDNVGSVRYGYDLRAAFKKVRELGASDDKAGQVGAAITALSEVKDNAANLIGKLFSRSDLSRIFNKEVTNAFCELGVRNIFNLSGTQFAARPLFLKPSGYNAFFDKLVAIPLTGTPLIDSEEERKKLEGEVVRQREESLRRMREMPTTSEDDIKAVKAESVTLEKTVLPEAIGDHLRTRQDLREELARKIGRILGEAISNLFFFWVPSKK